MATKWADINIAGHKALLTPLRPDAVSYPDCTDDGKELTRELVGKGKTVFRLDGEEYTGPILKLVNGKPKQKLTKTKEVTKVDRVPLKDVEGYDAEVVYYVKCDTLRDELKNKEEAITFAFSNGNGFKVFRAFVYVLSDTLLMKLSRVNIHKKIADIEAGILAGKELEDLQQEMNDETKANENEILDELGL